MGIRGAPDRTAPDAYMSFVGDQDYERALGFAAGALVAVAVFGAATGNPIWLTRTRIPLGVCAERPPALAVAVAIGRAVAGRPVP